MIITVYSKGYDEVLFTTEDRAEANDYLRQSGEDFLPVTVDYGEDRKARWTGIIYLGKQGEVVTASHYDLLEQFVNWPSPSATGGK
ncbi:hypothetical protein SEA_SQUINT_52 [Mycobacterium phage Squint]|uniref:Uncharacterized protein n=1 Tax=Mycobacterium phage Superphikiman TaxID=2041551 RepID=A0A2D2W3Y2_9CAUD|nr:hypothetical protein SEA_SQUINT_52 [Mycobacterium phage Squint]ATS92896.1 hypothetical protein SEA_SUPERPHIKIMAN_53 [Mycobacterium phage Superphikiman]